MRQSNLTRNCDINTMLQGKISTVASRAGAARTRRSRLFSHAPRSCCWQKNLKRYRTYETRKRQRTSTKRKSDRCLAFPPILCVCTWMWVLARRQQWLFWLKTWLTLLCRDKLDCCVFYTLGRHHTSDTEACFSFCALATLGAKGRILSMSETSERLLG